MSRFILLIVAIITQTASATTTTPLSSNAVKIQWRSCAVVQVTDLNDNLFEEGLGSIYDVTDDDGEPLTDEDAAAASIDLLARKRHIQFGHVTWTRFGTISSHTTHEDKQVVTVDLPDAHEHLMVRVFVQSKLMKLFRVNNKGAQQLVATADCSGVTDPRNRE